MKVRRCGRGNLISYYPDFVVMDVEGRYWILETKGMESEEVRQKDQAATLWADNATALTGKTWKYLKVPQKQFEKLQPSALSDLTALQL